MVENRNGRDGNSHRSRNTCCDETVCIGTEVHHGRFGPTSVEKIRDQPVCRCRTCPTDADVRVTNTLAGRSVPETSILGEIRGLILWVEGIIGAGKTTVANNLSERLGLKAVIEPAETNPFLELFYRQPDRWSFAMQMFLLRWRFAQQNEAMWASMQSRGVILDRGLPGDRVFAELHAKLGNMHSLEWMTYEQWFDTMACALRPPSILLYLDVEPEIAWCRMRGRGREAESSVTIDYLQHLRDGYEHMLEQVASGRHAWSQGIRIVRVPWNDGSDDEIIQILEKSVPGIMSSEA